MKIFYLFMIIFLLSNCSFDKKTGIWENEKELKSVKNDDTFKEFTNLSSQKKIFKQEIIGNENLRFDIPKEKINFQWTDIYYNKNNNLENFKYSNLNKKIFKSKKVSKNKINNKLLFYNDNIITSDIKGNIIVFSISENKIKHKFNFYRKKYKSIKKSLNLIFEKKIIYVSDNLGYLYAYDLTNFKILWAKNYKIPFRSNLKILDNKLMAASQNNNLYFFNKIDGSILKLIPTEETIITNKFINNLSLSNNNLFFLNNYGSLYSVNIKQMKINWFMNLNRSSGLNQNNLFLGGQILNYNNIIIVNTNNNTYGIDARNGSILYKKNFSYIARPIIVNNFVFLVTQNKYLIAMKLSNGEIIYSYDVSKEIPKKIKYSKAETFDYLMMLNNQLYLFFKNSFIFKFLINGKFQGVDKLPIKFKTNPIIIEDTLLYLTEKNTLVFIN